jgi:uncharacterized membrane protein YGL010W
MKSLNQWFDEYAVSHQNPTNKAIHYICVPAIYFSITGLLMSIPSDILNHTLKLNMPVLENWAFIAFIAAFIFYVRLSVGMAVKIALFTFVCLFVNYYVSQFVPLWIFSVMVFVVAWIGQFYGHNVEGKKPSFIKDLQFLLIGPAWVIENLFTKTK